MKKNLLTLFVVGIIFSLPLKAQTVFWEENFSPPPTGWALENNWEFTTTILRKNYYPIVYPYDLSATSPVISLPDNANNLVVSQCLFVVESSEINEVVEISMLVDGNEHQLWSYELVEGNWGASGGTEISLPVSEYAGNDVQLKFRSYGETADAWLQWDIYNVKINAFYEHDLAATGINGEHKVSIGTENTWSVSVKNMGVASQSDFDVKLVDLRTNTDIDVVNVSDPLGAGESVAVEFNWTADSALNTNFVGIVEIDNDVFEGNNTTEQHFVRVEPDTNYSILVLNMDNGAAHIIDPETEESISSYESVTRTLEAADIPFDLKTSIPANINDYNIVLCALGCYCLS